jgi:hypothetical protein
MDKDKSNRIRILIALIGLLGVVISAVISNWGEIFPRPGKGDDPIEEQKPPGPRPTGSAQIPAPALPSWLNGDWHVTLTEGDSPANRLAMGMLGPVEEDWRIRVGANSLSISSLTNYHLGPPYVQERPQKVSDVKAGRNQISFKLQDGSDPVYHYSLNLPDENSVSGKYSAKDDWHSGLPANEMFGTVKMRGLK